MDFDSIIGRHILFVCYNGLNVTCLSFVKNILYCYKNTMSCIKTYTENILYEYKYKYISMIRHQRQQHLNIHILCMLVEIKLVGPLLLCFYASGPWCNAQILLDGPLSLCETEKICLTGSKKNICIFGARMFAAYVEAFIGIIASDIRFAFSRSVWKGLFTGK